MAWLTVHTIEHYTLDIPKDTPLTTTYNGWKNYEPWNVALWMQNDEGFYGVAQQAEEIGDYIDFLFTNGHTHTPDGVEIDGSELDYEALDELVSSIA